jgi:hypothetical protein
MASVENKLKFFDSLNKDLEGFINSIEKHKGCSVKTLALFQEIINDVTPKLCLTPNELKELDTDSYNSHKQVVDNVLSQVNILNEISTHLNQQ